MLNVNVDVTYKDSTKVKDLRNVGEVSFEMKCKQRQPKE
jgi:hypothetical protein